jgi:hypothetical protein
MNEIPFSETPDHVLASISELIFTYSSPLLKITFDPPTIDNVQVVGSGTFVRVDDVYGLLTAYHVAANFEGDCSLGLALSPTEDNFKIHRRFLRVIEIGRPTTDEYGPDLAFIVFNDADCSEIASHKEFYPLSQNKDESLSYPPALDIGFWAACGAPQERIALENSESKYSSVVSIQLYCGFGRAEREYIKGEYDYFEMDADYTHATDAPSSFKGMSGGGLWQIPITITNNRNIIVNRYLLSGVTFWQSNQPEQKRFLRFHGRKSIYKNTWDSVLNHNSYIR